MMLQFFDFEADFVESLRCIPMQVRFKLDTCGIKLKLSHWHQLTSDERQRIIEAPCSTPSDVQTYRELICDLVASHEGDRPSEITVEDFPAWMNESTIPSTVMAKAESSGAALTLEHWRKLAPLQRFALIKLSQSQHENRNFLPALQEFQILSTN
jgi:hypothetical protein